MIAQLERSAPLADTIWHMATEVEPRALRADAERNRVKLLAAAHRVFAERGIEASVDDVAREAGVGMGTLYRRFPTKDHLVEAIIEDRFARLGESFASHAAVEDPWDAFAGCATALAEAIAEDRGFFQVVSESVQRLPHLREKKEALLATVGPVLKRAQKAGVVRRDVRAEDVPGLCAVAARLPRWRLEENPDLWRRYLTIVLDGLRPEGASRLPR
jgi:AcrR family transcriptional regulator